MFVEVLLRFVQFPWLRFTALEASSYSWVLPDFRFFLWDFRGVDAPAAPAVENMLQLHSLGRQ